MSKFFIIFVVFSASLMAQQTTPKEAFLEKWQNSKEYLLEMAKSMPSEKYRFKPTEREMTFTEQLLHIRGNMLWIGTTHFSEEKFDRNTLKENAPETKDEIVKAITLAFDKVYDQIKKTDPEDLKTEVDFFAGKKSKLQMLNLLQDHLTHHRGQLIVYLNLNKITPPRYVGW